MAGEMKPSAKESPNCQTICIDMPLQRLAPAHACYGRCTSRRWEEKLKHCLHFEHTHNPLSIMHARCMTTDSRVWDLRSRSGNTKWFLSSCGQKRHLALRCRWASLWTSWRSTGHWAEASIIITNVSRLRSDHVLVDLIGLNLPILCWTFNASQIHAGMNKWIWETCSNIFTDICIWAVHSIEFILLYL